MVINLIVSYKCKEYRRLKINRNKEEVESYVSLKNVKKWLTERRDTLYNIAIL